MSVEHVINGLADGNLINDARTTGFYPYALGITGQHIVARNNILVNAPIGIEVFGQPQLPINFVDQIYLYNNTSYFFPVPPFPASYGTNFMALFTTTGTVIAENNIFAEGETLTGVQTNFLQTDNMGKVTEDHNLSFAPNVKGTWTPATGTADIVGDPKFASTSVTDANAFPCPPAARRSTRGRPSRSSRTSEASCGRPGQAGISAPASSSSDRRRSPPGPAARCRM